MEPQRHIIPVVHAQAQDDQPLSSVACTAEQVVTDSCTGNDVNGICNAGSSICPDLASDCFDCDPCQVYALSATGCDACIAAGCQWCSVPSLGLYACSTPSIAQIYTNVCSSTATDGTPYQTTCGDGSTTTPPAPAPAATLPTTTTSTACSLESDSCKSLLNGKCEADGVTCAAGSDCFDCDPCLVANRFSGCEACVANTGCLWCADDAVCISSDANYLPGLFICQPDTGFSSICPSTTTLPYPDPLYQAQAWLFDQINLLPVWEAGFTGTGIGIRINDDGVDATHPEFSAKFNVDSSCQIYLPVALDVAHSHGTTCASLAAGSGGDGSPCSVGIAPDAAISACRVVPENPPQSGENSVTPEAADYSFLYVNMDNMHVSSNSYGIDGCSPISTRRRNTQQRLLQGGCPFQSSVGTSPCTAFQCANVDWSTLTTDSVMNSTCESYVVLYCQVFFEVDVTACTSFLDLGVKCEYNGQPIDQLNAMMAGISQGRDGKGIVYVYAVGNTYFAGSDVNFEGSLNSRYTISVGAVGKNGIHASYSIPGSPLFVTAPGGDFESYTNNIVALAGGGCQDGGAGTSFSAPIVAGVVALILQANPDLSWRDVQGVLASTSRMVQPNDPSWTMNAAGFHHSYLYGFGLIDANASVTAAQSWEYYTPEILIMAESGMVNVTIPDSATKTVNSTIAVEAAATFVTESVIVYLDLMHSSRGDVQIVLTSPSGTDSILAPGQRPENTQTLERWRLMTVRNWGEPANGTWMLSLVDQRPGDLTTCVNIAGWSIEIGTNNPIVFDCEGVRRGEICVNGAQGPGFITVFSRIATDISDPFFTDENGVAMVDACCDCGGGVNATQVPDVLHSWRIAVYGRDPSMSSPIPSTTTGQPTILAETVSPTASQATAATERPVDAPAAPQTSPLTPNAEPQQQVGSRPTQPPLLPPAAVPRPTQNGPTGPSSSAASTLHPCHAIFLLVVGISLLLHIPMATTRCRS